MQTAHRKLRFNLLALPLLAVIAVMAIAPFYYLLITSLKPGVEIFRSGMNFRFDLGAASWENYATLFTSRNGDYLRWFKNSIVISLMYTVASVSLSSMVGYGFAAYKFKGKKALFFVVLSVMMLPIETMLLPIYNLLVGMRLVNTYLGVVLPFAVSPFAVFFFKQYVSTLPTDFIDSGRIDGCSELGIFARIMVPMMLPAFGAIAILQAMASWNDFLWPLIVMSATENFTLPIGLQTLLTPYGNNYEMIFPGATLSVVPIVIVFLFCQKSFISGLTVGGVKG